MTKHLFIILFLLITCVRIFAQEKIDTKNLSVLEYLEFGQNREDVLRIMKEKKWLLYDYDYSSYNSIKDKTQMYADYTFKTFKEKKFHEKGSLLLNFKNDIFYYATLHIDISASEKKKTIEIEACKALIDDYITTYNLTEIECPEQNNPSNKKYYQDVYGNLFSYYKHTGKPFRNYSYESYLLEFKRKDEKQITTVESEKEDLKKFFPGKITPGEILNAIYFIMSLRFRHGGDKITNLC